MADANTKSKIDAAAEKAYAEAAEKASSGKTTAKKVADAVESDAPKAEVSEKAVEKAVAAPAKTTAAKKAPAKKAPVKKTAAKSASTRKAPAKKAPARKTPDKRTAAKKTVVKTPSKTSSRTAAKTASAKKAPAKAASKKTVNTKSNPVTKLKDTIMATAEKTDITAQAKEMASDMQERLKTAYAKTGEFAGEVNEFNKANVDAVVESGKIFFAGAQELVKDNVETGKTVVETVTEDAKKMAAVKSPTELMQLQGELARRNFDAVVSYGSQRTEAWVKLYNDAFAPISNRVSVAAEKITKAA
ncbi:MAG: TIGR01841 family phasin [Erythrobacter sp.]|uniref:phasin family protein n=1 Tax=Erythrobacter sp. TaxID=1042 RepID=UPI00260DB2A0|nr:TIGR01841 family phasin [Erythrobacter sp.]MDJ0979232.1 TIGR01841 family phasin [Erythrobacter sp.]